jgi:hypothetical protein
MQGKEEIICKRPMAAMILRVRGLHAGQMGIVLTGRRWWSRRRI